MMNEFWNARYAEQEYAYGEEPNEFFRNELQKLTPGKLLLPAEGEGRNAVFAARLGWHVTAFDASSEGKKKAAKLAEKYGVAIHYEVASFESFIAVAEANSFDCVAFTFVHTPPVLRSQLHQNAINWLKAGGKIILQGFSKGQINENSGGPREISMLFSEEELKSDFQQLSAFTISSEEVILKEGKYHDGKAQVISLTGIK